MSCPNCFTGGISTVKPTGTETAIHGLPTYVAQPPDGVPPKALVIFLPDAFGWDFVNNRVLCDTYAREGGFLVWLPDFMNGYSMSPKAIAPTEHVLEPASTCTSFLTKPLSLAKALYLTVPWMLRTSISKTWPGVLSFFQAVRRSPPPFPSTTKDGSLKVGVAGFCWGGKHAILLSHDNPATRVVQAKGKGEPQRLVDAVFTAHPSFMKLPHDAEAIRVPTSVVTGDVDAVMKPKTAFEMKRILDARGSDEHEMRIEPGAKHGFAIRTHPEDEHEVNCAKRAESQAIEWFNRWLV